MDPELEALRQARMAQMQQQGGGEAAQKKVFQNLFFSIFRA